MSVLVEAITLVIPLEVIERCFEGGLETYRRIVPNQTLRSDKLLTAFSLTTPQDVALFIEKLESLGMVFIEEGESVDMVVVDQHTGPTTPCPWLDFASNDEGPASCWKKGTEPGELEAYPNWSYENSLGSAFEYIETKELNEDWELVRQTELGSVFRHKESGEEALLSSQYWADHSTAVDLTDLATQIQNILREKTRRFESSETEDGVFCWFFELEGVSGLISCEHNNDDLEIPTVTLVLPLADTEDLSREDLMELLSRNSDMYHASLTCTAPFFSDEKTKETRRLLAIQHRFAVEDFVPTKFLEYVEMLQFNAVTFLPELFDPPTIH